MQAAAFADSVVTQQIWSEEKYYFERATTSTTNCGNVTYRVLEADSLLQLNQTVFSLNMTSSIPYVKVKLTEKQPWVSLSPFSIVIEAKLGTYKTVYSNPLEITISDPCIYTTITS
jgi:hypothetical protein